MFVDFGLLGVALPWQSVSNFLHFFPPPGHLLPGDFVFQCRLLELADCSFLQLLLLQVDHLAHLVELLGDFLKDVAALRFNYLLVLVNFGLRLPDLFY